MLLCDQAFVDKGRRPQKIYCKLTDGGPCAHVRYCASAMKYYQTDNAKKCIKREDHNDGQTE